MKRFLRKIFPFKTTGSVTRNSLSMSSVTLSVLVAVNAAMVVYGKFPDGVIVYPGKWQSVSKRMVDFAVQNGYREAVRNIETAKAHMAQRIERKKAKLKRPDAKDAVMAYYRANKDTLPNDIGKHREELIQSMMDGLSVEEAFGRFV